MKKIFLFHIPMSICNFRCSYCYLAQRDSCYEGVMPKFKYSPAEFARAVSRERVGGIAYGNFTAAGETLLMNGLLDYIKAFVEQGHYAEIVTNLSITSKIDEILSWDESLRKRIEFKCSFHYLQLKEKNLLQTFADNVNRIWEAGASANIEITPADELIPYIDEIKEFSLSNFGALPQLSIARDDRTDGIDYLTDLSMDEYDSVWSQFNSDFWRFKKELFGVKRKEFCYAGAWSYYVDLTTGQARQCYCGKCLGDIFADVSQNLPYSPIGRCKFPHCYNGHMFLSLGLIPRLATVHYGDIRNRIKIDNKGEWLQSELLTVFNERLYEQNIQLSTREEKIRLLLCDIRNFPSRGLRFVKKVVRNRL